MGGVLTGSVDMLPSCTSAHGDQAAHGGDQARAIAAAGQRGRRSVPHAA
jgi:hypothetical protein